MRYRTILKKGSRFTQSLASRRFWRSPLANRGGRARGAAILGIAVMALLGGCRAKPEPIDTADTAADLAPIHPAFDLTGADLPSMLAGLPEETVAAVSSRPQVFLDYVRRMLAEDPILLVLVDKQHLLDDTYAPQDLQDLNQYRDHLVLNRDDLSLRAAILPDFFAMVAAARLDGVTLDISSSYRSYAYQENLFEYWVSELGLAEAERVSARAGSSQHQLGTTIDFGSVTVEFADTPGGRWLAEHAWRYGFSLSYPEGFEDLTGYSYEPWHFRYISRTAARMEREFFGGVQQRMLEFWNRQEPFFRQRLRDSAHTDVVAPE